MKIISVSFVILCLSLLQLQSFATWSIIVIDAKTKQIGIAGASCTNSVYGIGAVVPGKGAVVVQAMSNPFARGKGIKMIMADAAPDEILKAMMDPDFDPEEQQYAIISVNELDKPLTYTGSLAHQHKGALTKKGISVQGNTLADPKALQAILDAAVLAQQISLPIEDVLMLALEAGAKFGGDKRCGEIKALSAFLTVVNPDDDRKHPYINLIVYGTDDRINAVEALRKKFNAWKK